MSAYTGGSQYTKGTHHMKIALWIARRNRPFSIVEDPELLYIFADLNIHCITPKQRTVSCDMKEIFHISQANLASMLRVRISLLSSSSTSAQILFRLHAEISRKVAYLRGRLDISASHCIYWYHCPLD